MMLCSTLTVITVIVVLGLKCDCIHLHLSEAHHQSYQMAVNVIDDECSRHLKWPVEQARLRIF